MPVQAPPGALPDLSSYSTTILERTVRENADSLRKGLSIAPKRSMTAPCSIILPVQFHWFLVYVNEVAGRRSMKMAALLRYEQGAFLDALIGFANSKWTAEQKETFLSCRCRKHNTEAAKDFREGTYSDPRGYCKSAYGPLHELVYSVFSLIADLVNDIKMNPTDAIKLERKPKKSGRWPSSPSKFLPHGPTAALSAFMAWAQLVEDAMPIHVLGLLATFFPSLETEMIQNENLIPGIATLFSQFVSKLQTINPEEMNPRRRIAIDQNSRTFLTSFSKNWFRAHLFNDTNREKAIPAFKSLYKSLCAYLSVINRFEFPHTLTQQLKDECAILAMSVSRSVHAITGTYPSDSEPTPIALHPQFMDRMQFGREHVDAISFYRNIINLRSQAKCTDISCTQTSEITKSNFKLCAECQAVRYCSKACQVADWKEHKTVCKRLKLLLPIALSWDPIDPGEACADDLADRYLAELQDAGLVNEDIYPVRYYVRSHIVAGMPWLPFVPDL